MLRLTYGGPPQFPLIYRLGLSILPFVSGCGTHAIPNAPPVLPRAAVSGASPNATESPDDLRKKQPTHQPGEPAGESRPQIVSVYAISPECLALVLEDRRVVRQDRVPLQQRPYDEIRPEGPDVPVWRDGRVVEEARDRVLYRLVGDARVPQAWCIGGRRGSYERIWHEDLIGIKLSAGELENATYEVRGEDEPTRGGGHPVRVYVKSKPCDQAMRPGFTDNKALRHVVYLELEQPLQEGRNYWIHIGTPSWRSDPIRYRHDPHRVVTEALHVNQVGYRPDDPFKRAYLSVWRGSGGAWRYAMPLPFEIMDNESGTVCYRGVARLAWNTETREQPGTGPILVGTNVYHLDFHDFGRPGTYRIVIPGIGSSLPFRISEQTWTEAFRVSMHGLLCHRSGIALGPPLTSYRRPRPMHPADGFVVFDLDITSLEGEADAVRREITGRLRSGSDPSEWETLSDAWGGYMDAGDWDRRWPHLYGAHLLMELYEMYPEAASDLRWNLPEEDLNSAVPPILAEVLWSVDFFFRLQTAEGGVRGGVESTEHPRWGEASWEETLVVGAFGPDPAASYAAASAGWRAARLVRDRVPDRARQLAAAAERAWRWAEERGEGRLAEILKRSPHVASSQVRAELQRQRTLAAVERFRWERDAASHELCRMLLEVLPDVPDRTELLAWFSYLLEAPSNTDTRLRERGSRVVLSQAEVALRFGDQNPFNVHCRIPQLPILGYVGFYSVPETNIGPVLPRAYWLTGERRYLRGAVAAAHFAAGANPDNMTFTTGLGHRFPTAPLHIDSRVTGQPAPAGITVYGPMDMQADWEFNRWVHQWHLTDMFPPSRTWPSAESYVDLFLWPAMCEYTVHQTIMPSAYYYGFLAIRPKTDRPDPQTGADARARWSGSPSGSLYRRSPVQ